MVERKVYSAEEVGEILGLSRNVIYELLKKGEIPRRRLGRQYIIPKQSFNEWLEKTMDCGEGSGG